MKLESQWADPVLLTSRTNQKKKKKKKKKKVLPMSAMFVNGSGRNEQSL